jgi:hypothetical protein
MTNQELFKQAIADAKSVRDAAVANAKAALEETFTPKIMSMLSNKLNEMEEDDIKEDDSQEEGLENAIGYEAGSQKPGIEETDLEEILAQLEAEEKEGKSVDEAKKEKDGDKVEEAKKEDDKKKKVEESLDEAEGDDEMTELTVDELKDIIRDVLSDVMGGEEAGEEKGEEGEETGDESEGDDAKELDLKELNLDELLAELAKEDDDDKVNESKKEKEEKMKKKEKVEESVDAINEDVWIDIIKQIADVADIGFAEAERLVNMLGGGGALATVGGLLMKAAKKDKAAGGDPASGIAKSMTGNMEEAKKDKKDLEEAIKTIRILRDELNEVNLLNAKLLYSNKIFKAKNLSESQKVNVLKAFDKASSIKETKVIYTTLSESLNTKTKSTIKESVGFASKAAGVAPKQPIVEGDAAIRRMQQLAGIIK